MAKPYAVVPSHFNPAVYEALDAANNVIFFQWDLTDDTFQLRESDTTHRYDLPNYFPRASTRLTLEGIVHPDDAGMLEYYLHRLYHARPASRRHNHLTARLRLRSTKKPLWLWSEIHLITYYENQRPAMAFGNIRNIQAEKLWQERICRRANVDELTGILSKAAVKMQIRAALRRMCPKKDTATLLIVDADDFKSVNDTFGHLFGDKVLHEVGHALNCNFRQSDIKGRIGGDEFIILLPGMECTEILARHCQSLCRRLTREFHADGKSQTFSVSIGAAQYPAHGQSYKELFTHADQALYKAKGMGKGQYVLYQPDMSEQADGNKPLLTDPIILPPSSSEEQEKSIASLEARIEQLQDTIDGMRQIMLALLQVKH